MRAKRTGNKMSSKSQMKRVKIQRQEKAKDFDTEAMAEADWHKRCDGECGIVGDTFDIVGDTFDNQDHMGCYICAWQAGFEKGKAMRTQACGYCGKEWPRGTKTLKQIQAHMKKCREKE